MTRRRLLVVFIHLSAITVGAVGGTLLAFYLGTEPPR